MTIANFVSMGRLLLLIPLFYFLREGDRENGNVWALAVMAVAMVSDMLDGLSGARSESGFGLGPGA